MRKLWKSRKALSPVVAAIILIAVTVAVSIAVAAWMGAISFTFMATEEITFIDYNFDSSATTHFNVTIQNTGASDLTLSQVKVGGENQTWSLYTLAGAASSDNTLSAGEKVVIKITYNWSSGTKYNVEVVTTKGNRFGPYTVIAP